MTDEIPTTAHTPLWAHTPRLGPYPYYDNAQELWLDCVSYFNWVEATPVLTIDVVKYQGDLRVVDVPVPRPMTQMGLCVFLGITHGTWRQWRTRTDEIGPLIATVDAIIFEQKFTGACVGLFNPALVARELGLMHKEPEDPLLFPPEELPLITRDMSATDAAALYAQSLEQI